ncbi:MAG: hypothetical protein ACLRFL_02370 [Clostridia bacterium]
MKSNLVRKLLITLTITATIGSGASAKFLFDKSLDTQDDINYYHDKIQSTLLEYAQTEEFQNIYNEAIDTLTEQYINGAISYEQYSSKMMEIHSSSFIQNVIDEHDSNLSRTLRNLDDKINDEWVTFTYYTMGFCCFVMATPTIPFASYCLLKNDNDELSENLENEKT